MCLSICRTKRKFKFHRLSLFSNINQFFLRTKLFYYLSATRCGGDIVTLLWFRPSVRPSFRLSVRGPCEHDRDYTDACFFVKFGRHVDHDERRNPIDLIGQRSKVKVTIDIYGNKLVNTIATKPLRAS